MYKKKLLIVPVSYTLIMSMDENTSKAPTWPIVSYYKWVSKLPEETQ